MGNSNLETRREKITPGRRNRVSGAQTFFVGFPGRRHQRKSFWCQIAQKRTSEGAAARTGFPGRNIAIRLLGAQKKGFRGPGLLSQWSATTTTSYCILLHGSFLHTHSLFIIYLFPHVTHSLIAIAACYTLIDCYCAHMLLVVHFILIAQGAPPLISECRSFLAQAAPHKPMSRKHSSMDCEHTSFEGRRV